MFEPVRGVPAGPPVTGLLVSAARPDTTGQRWEQGFSWVPERCGVDYQLIPWCTTEDPAPYTEPRVGAVYCRPVGVRFADECTTLAGRLDTARMERIAEATTPFVVARELWTGEISSTDTWTIQGTSGTNQRLADPEVTTITPVTTSVLRSLAKLEAAALEASRGQQVMLHLPVLASAALAAGDYVQQDGQNWVTRAGNLVVIDAGYPGTGPNEEAAGATVWTYASSLVQVRLSSLEIITDPGQTVDRATNTITAWAERLFASCFDPCVHLACEITL